MVTKIVIVKDEVITTSFNEDGDVIFKLIYNSLKDKQPVTVSFENIYAVNTSFVNSAFIELLEHFSFDEIKRNLKIINSTKQINTHIANRFKYEENRKVLVTN